MIRNSALALCTIIIRTPSCPRDRRRRHRVRAARLAPRQPAERDTAAGLRLARQLRDVEGIGQLLAAGAQREADVGARRIESSCGVPTPRSCAGDAAERQRVAIGRRCLPRHVAVEHRRQPERVEGIAPESLRRGGAEPRASTRAAPRLRRQERPAQLAKHRQSSSAIRSRQAPRGSRPLALVKRLAPTSTCGMPVLTPRHRARHVVLPADEAAEQREVLTSRKLPALRRCVHVTFTALTQDPFDEAPTAAGIDCSSPQR